MKDVRYLYENTPLTLENIANRTGYTLNKVWRYTVDNYSKSYREERKRKNYSSSKQGSNNPMKGLFGAAHPNYKGRISDGKGYILILKPDWYTGRKGSKHVFEHSVIMCLELGITETPKGYCVHHIDKDPTNNSTNNLALLTVAAHTRLHQLERATTIRKE